MRNALLEILSKIEHFPITKYYQTAYQFVYVITYLFINYKEHRGIVTHEGRLFWTQPYEGKIFRAFRNGTDVRQEQTLVSSSLSPRGITADTRNG